MRQAFDKYESIGKRWLVWSPVFKHYVWCSFTLVGGYFTSRNVTACHTTLSKVKRLALAHTLHNR